MRLGISVHGGSAVRTARNLDPAALEGPEVGVLVDVIVPTFQAAAMSVLSGCNVWQAV